MHFNDPIEDSIDLILVPTSSRLSKNNISKTAGFNVSLKELPISLKSTKSFFL
jgi:hypothetical protein